MAMSADTHETIHHVHLGGQFGYQNVHVHTSKVLWTGSYGSVVKATLDHLPCAAKILHTIFFRDDDPGAVDFAARFDQKCDILRALKHPCTVQFLGVVQDPSNRKPILLMELMEESLTGFLERATTSLPYHVQVNITNNIALALAGNSIIHRDLSSNNILLRGGGRQAKVTDFAMSKMVEANPRMTRSKITQFPGTPAFQKPCVPSLATPTSWTPSLWVLRRFISSLAASPHPQMLRNSTDRREDPPNSRGRAASEGYREGSSRPWSPTHCPPMPP